MLRVHCTIDDLLQVSIAQRPMPMLELSLALSVLSRGNGSATTAPWWRNLRESLPRAAYPIMQLASPTGASPLFLDPPSDGLEDGLDQVLSTSPAVVRSDLQRTCSKDRPVTPWIRLLAGSDRETWGELERAVRVTYARVIEREQGRLRAGFAAEVAWRGRLLAEQGVRSTLQTLHPSVRLNGTTLEIDFPRDWEGPAGGHGIVLQPSLFWDGFQLDHEPGPDGRLVVIYPATTPLALLDPAPTGDALANLLGGTRAEALRLLTTEHTTTGLARELGVSQAAASLQAKSLREAGLIVSRRGGRAVWHRCTPLGLDLLAANPTAPVVT